MDELMTEEAAAAVARDLAGRAGYDTRFLGLAVLIPALPGMKTVLVVYAGRPPNGLLQRGNALLAS
jgi:hypothetical protein